MLQHPPFPQNADRSQLLLGGLHHLGGVGIIAVTAAVNLVVQFFFQSCLHNSHGGNGCAKIGKQVGNLLALLQVKHMVAAPGRKLGIKSQHLIHERKGFSGNT